MERRLQNSLWALGATLAVALLLGSLRPPQAPHRLVSPGPTSTGVIATGAVADDADADADATLPSHPRSLRRHGLSMPYFSFSSIVGG